MAETVAAWGPGDAKGRLRRATDVLEGRFTFLNHSETLPQVDWCTRYVSHLWSYNLQYFDYAIDLAWAFRITGDCRFVRRFEDLADSWIASAAPGRGDAWEPYSTSLRLVNWTYALLLFGDSLQGAFRQRLISSLYAQSVFLERRLEFHILANHLQKNLKALAVVSLLFSGPRAERWRDQAGRRLWSELYEQVLPDGGHFERSPMYHVTALADYLETVALFSAIGEAVPDAAQERIRRMAHALGVLMRPDGSLHLFNDTANGIAPSREYVSQLIALVLAEPFAQPQGVVELPDSGYFGFVDSAAGERFLIDCGIPGPAYQPAHAHCDLLSFELDIDGQPLIVDSGVHGYEGDPFREYTRSTRAHNTVAIAGREQSEIWGTFRVARRAEPISAACELSSDGFRFAGAYRPYHDRNVSHHREVRRDRACWIVTDWVSGAKGKALASYLHFHPNFALEVIGNSVRAKSPSLSLAVTPFGVDGCTLRVGSSNPVQGWYCPEFGRATPSHVLEMHVERNLGSSFGYRIEPVESA
jgi:uncharacterized heparinase superfamily protein